MPSPPRGYASFPTQADLFYFCTTSSTSEEDLNLHYAPPSKSSLKIGVLVLSQEQTQLFDLAALDLLAMVGRNRISKLNASTIALDESVDELDIRYVSASGEGSFPITSGARMPVTNSFANAPLFDIIIVPGSYTSSELPVSATTFLTTQASNPDLVAIMSVSSGVLHLTQTGILHQKRATGPACQLSALRQRYPEIYWEAMPWTRQEKLWSSNSAVTALDMMTAFMREYFWDRNVAVECALSAAGVGSLEEYDI